MAVKVTVTKTLEERIRKSLDSGPIMEHCGTLIRQLVSLLDDAHDKKTRKAEQSGGLDPKEVIKTIKGVLGNQAYFPPNPGSAFYGFVAKRTKFLNLSLQDIERAAVHVRSHWKLPTSGEWIIRKLDQILEEAAQAEGAEPPDDGADAEWIVVTGREDV